MGSSGIWLADSAAAAEGVPGRCGADGCEADESLLTSSIIWERFRDRSSSCLFRSSAKVYLGPHQLYLPKGEVHLRLLPLAVRWQLRRERLARVIRKIAHLPLVMRHHRVELFLLCFDVVERLIHRSLVLLSVQDLSM